MKAVYANSHQSSPCSCADCGKGLGLFSRIDNSFVNLDGQAVQGDINAPLL
jgi:hypothetical protein